jgi:hypothetical protein
MFLVNDIVFYLIYRSPNAPPQIMNDLESLVRGVKKNAILVGDFNLPDIDWEMGTGSARTASFLEAVDDVMLTQMVDFSTQVKGNCLDLVLTNIPERIVDIEEAGRLGKSDHEMILLTVGGCGGSVHSNREVYNWGRADWTSMKNDLAGTDWSATLHGKSADEMWTTFRSRLDELRKKYVPTRVMRNRQRPLWMTKEILQAINRKRRLWKEAKKGRNREQYEEADTRVQKLIRNAKRNYEKRLATGNGGNNRSFYSYVKQRTKSRPSIGPLRNEKKEMVSDDQGMTELLNNFFGSVFTREDTANIPVAKEMEAENMKEVVITAKMVRTKIKSLKEASAAGPDNVGPRLLRELGYELAPALVKIFRRSLEYGEVPEEWKVANVTPIFKKGSKADPGNYRPVSLTSVCCKLLESILRDSMMEHLLSKNLLKASQHGFIPGRSCCTNLLEFLERATAVIDAGKPMDVIFLDFAKAFDKVPRERLLEKLKAHRIRGKTLAWIRNWLTGRKQRVVLNGKYSTWAEVLSGVPQGSVLGPILFLIFINDLDDDAMFIELLKKFADDTKLGHTATTPEDRETLQLALDNLCDWSERWGMAFNVKKCKVMHLGYNNPCQVYTMRGQALEETDEERDIGVEMSKSLKPSAQCAKAARTAQAVLSQMARAFHYRDRHIFLRLYKQYVRPHLEFASAAWSPWQEGDKAALEKIQRRAVSMISGLRGESYEEKLLELDLPTLEERRHTADMVQTFKIVKGIDRVEHGTWFHLAANGERATRSTDCPHNLRQMAARLEVRRNFFSNRVIDSWNQLPTHVKNVKTVSSFKNGYKNYTAGLVPPT